MTDENKVAETVSADEKLDSAGAAGAGASGVANDSCAAGAAGAAGATPSPSVAAVR